MKKRVLLVMAVWLLQAFWVSGAWAQTDVEALSRQAGALYSEEERALLQEKADALAAYEGVVPIDVGRIVNKSMNFKFDTPPVIKDGRTLVPIRTLSEAFEASVLWDPLERKVTVRKGQTELLVWIDKTTVRTDGRLEVIDVSAMILNGRTMVPLRFICERLGLTIQYHEKTGIIEIID